MPSHLRPAPTRAEPPVHSPNAALLIDFDNVTLGVRSEFTKELRTLLNSDIIKGKVAVQRAYADWRGERRNLYADGQMELYRAGHALLGKGHSQAALAVFTLWAQGYPNAAYAHDGLGAAYLALGDRAKALVAYQKALKLDPSSASALEAVGKLKLP